MGTLGIGILGSLVASLIYDVPKGIYAYIQKNKPIEEKLKKAFKNAVEAYFQDERQQGRVIDKDEGNYIELLKKELAGEPNGLESEKYKGLYEHFNREIIKDEELAKYLLIEQEKVTQELVRTNSKEIKKSIGEIAEQQRVGLGNIDNALQQIHSIVEIPEFSIANADDEHRGNQLPLPAYTAKREKIVEELCHQLSDYKILILYGTKQIGKSTLARLICQRYASIVKECKEVSDFQLIKYTIQQKTEASLMVLDNLPIKYVERTIELLSTDITSKQYILTTEERFDQSLVNFQVPALCQYEVPLLSEEEVAEIIESYHPTEDIKPIVALCANHHPMLVRATCQYLQAKGWHYAYRDIEQIIKNKHFDSLHPMLARSIEEIKDEEAQHLLNRLLFIQVPFTEDDAVAIADIEPKIAQPRRRFQQIKGSWLSTKDEIHYQITPILKRAWKPDVSQEEKRACNKYLGYTLLSKRQLTESDAISAINYYLSAELYEEAGGIYVKIITSAHQEIPEKSLFNVLWIGVDLPKQMPVGLRVVIRVSQLLSLKNLPKDMQDLVYRDLMKIVDMEGTAIPNASIVYRLMSSICFFQDDMYNGLRYYKMSGSMELKIDKNEAGPLMLPWDEIESYMHSGLWLLLMRVDNEAKFEDWLQTYKDANQESYSMHHVDYEGCYFFVWRYIDLYHKELPFEEQLKVLDRLLNKAETNQIDALVVMILFKKMEMHSIKRDYEPVCSIFKENIDKYRDNELAILLLNAAYGYALYQEGKEENRDESLAYLKKALTCPSEEILPAIHMHVMEVISYIESETDPQLALQSMLAAYDYIQQPDHHLDSYSIYNAKGELAHAKWLAGQREAAVADLSECIEFVLDEVVTDSPFSKAFLCKCDCALTYYESQLSGRQLTPDMAIPRPGLYSENNNDNLEALYSDRRILTSAVLLYFACNELQMIELREKWLYKSIAYQKREGVIKIEHGIMQMFYPHLLRKGDIENALYVCQVNMQATEMARKERQKVRDSDSLLFILQVMPMILYANLQIIEKNDYSALERVHELLDGLNDSQSEYIAIAKELLMVQPADMGPVMYYKDERCKAVPLYHVISALLLTKEETPIPHAFLSMCSIIKDVRSSCESYYHHEMDWVFDELVVEYWNKKITTHPEAFNGIERYKQYGIAQVEREQENKARKCLHNISFHVNELEMPPYIENWVLD